MPAHLASKVLLIGWDGADWKVITPLLDAGLMPNLERLIDGGVMGNLATLEPMLSPILWTSIATGKRADKHGVLGFTEPAPNGAGIRPVTTTSRRCMAFWNILHLRGLTCNVVGWWPGHPAEPIRGAYVSNHYHRARAPLGEPWPMPRGTVHPARLAEPLADLRVHPGELSAEHLLPFIPQAARVDQDRDPCLATCAKLIADCSSVHAAATWLMATEPWDVTAVYYDAIDHFSHAFMPYHPPRLPHVAEPRFELLKDVLSAAYRYHDLMLGRLVELAPEDATVLLLSDHGFHSDHLRPRAPRLVERHAAASWHRRHGILCMKGPGIRQDERIYGATLLDVAPTVLTLFGLPVADDMDGRPLLQAFMEPPAVERIPSWEAVEGDRGMLPPDGAEDPWEAHEALRQLVDLGYIEPPDADAEKAIGATLRERRYNLARVHWDAGRPGEAAALLEELREEEGIDEKEADRYALLLAQCCYESGAADRCRELIDELVRRAGPRPGTDLLLGSLASMEGRDEEALTHLLAAETARPRLPMLHCEIGRVHLRTRRWNDAERAFRVALSIDPDAPGAHRGLSRALLALDRPEEAAEEALVAVGLLHFQPQAHLQLGVALARLGKVERARLAFETAVSLSPGTAAAHRWLAQLYERALCDPAKAAEHRRLADAADGGG